jgi:hypothetical protein
MGSITWAGDPFDQILSSEKLATLPPLLVRQAHRYAYTNGRGERILCWDHGRFVNHSCSAACLSPGFDFEIAVRDIAPGEEITDDYGTLNLEEPFDCLCGSPDCRGRIMPDDPVRHSETWDALLARAFPAVARVDQPLWELVREQADVRRVVAGDARLPSSLTHYRALKAEQAAAV